jgi:GNAT superfamily N-acetyltransferase
VSLSEPELLSRSHQLDHFSCGQPALDRWLKSRALSNQERGFTVVVVVHQAGRVVGYYGIAPTAIIPESLPRAVRTGQPPHPLPCLLLGQLATDVAWAGRGVGTGLLKHALGRCVEGARLVGGRALLVRAVDAAAAAFWTRRGFLPTRDDPFLLFRSMADIAASLEAAGLR